MTDTALLKVVCFHSGPSWIRVPEEIWQDAMNYCESDEGALFLGNAKKDYIAAVEDHVRRAVELRRRSIVTLNAAARIEVKS